MTISKVFLVIICLCMFCTIKVDAFPTQKTITIDSIRKAELYLKGFADSLTLGTTDLARQAGAAGFNRFLTDLLTNPETFHYPFDSLKAISKIKSPDGKVRLFTWTLQSRIEGNYTYFGVTQKMDLKTKKFKSKSMTEEKLATAEAETTLLSPENWYGALYYEIVERKIKKRTYYFLLGWHGNDIFTTRKVIDVLHFDESENIVFGAPLFVDDDKNKTKRFRVIFEYTREAVMLLRYDKKKKMIVFDHLSPPNASARGQFRYYGPDFTYDGYRFRKGVWNYQSNLDLRNPSVKN